MPSEQLQAGDAFLSSLERDMRDSSSRSQRDSRDRGAPRDSHRDYDRSDRSSRRSHRRRDEEDDDAKYRSSRRDPEEDDRRHRRSERDYSPSRSSRRRRDDDGYYAARREDDYSRSSRPRRDAYDDPYDPYGARRDPYDSYSRGGGGGGWRGGESEPTPARMRSPTPEGTQPISKRVRRDSKWNVRAEGFEDVSAAQAKATGLFGVPGQSRTLGVPGAVIGRDSTGQAVIPEALPPIRFGGAGDGAAGASGAGTGANDPNQVGSGMSSANRQSRRLYIGNVSHSTTEAMFVRFWNDRMKEMRFNIADGEPCISSQVNPDKGYAFVEFRCPEEATNAMSFDGVVFAGQALKIRRPKDYTGPDVTPKPLHVPGVISTNVPDGPNKIYVGSLPTYLNEDQIIELLKAFGEVRAFNLVREANNGPSKGFAFCEYVDSSITDLACEGLNDMELGDRKLVVQRASAGQRTAGQSGLGATGANAGPLGGGRGFDLGSAAQGAGDPTRCMTMLNMVTTDELVDDVEYGEIVEDIREECAKYGHVADVRIPRPVAQSKGSSAQAWRRTQDSSAGSESNNADGQPREREGVGRVYVRFVEVDQCESALKAIAGRQFGGRLVICAFLREEDWPSEEDGGENAEATAQQASGPKPAEEAAGAQGPSE
ncbi:hypothetical protein BCV69DRAFT_282089 [Microstroma glucosiphilum]|uniref:RRM domain-containing protein n=1 Tax=Pseudomicrostroma glucosiphilum TaxID=1684307 RepID=A0A316U808_9BASI|nr:hypothetical protein BCV69DRAFT_282089 [Pseudomicrostroma glucosiphilum]PWN21356.1 hypothetical protein BCV69DRAFT_282089 [Pseudomicrostroma glucosiphilum]